MPVTSTTFRRLALTFDDVVEGAHMRHPDFRCGGRIFATLQPDGHRGMVKLTPPQQRRWLLTAGSGLEPASGAWGRQGCTMVTLAKVRQADLVAMLTEAWQNAMASGTKKRAKK